MDPNLFRDYQTEFNVLQDISSDGDNSFNLVQQQYVATIGNAFLEGESGLIYDAEGNVYHLPYYFYNRTNPILPMPSRSDIYQAKNECIHINKAATFIQRYGHMYYHFLGEALPRMVLMQQQLLDDPSIKILTWGQPYEKSYLELLGITDRSSQIMKYNPSAVYCIDELYVPSPIPRITPSRESLMSVRQAMGVKTPPLSERNIIIYVSRENEESRRVVNELDIIAAIQQSFSEIDVVVFRGDLSAKDTIQLFERARAVVGIHGAGLTHILWSAPDTVVIELTFLESPPLMFWHISAALDLSYWLVPISQSYWLIPDVEAPTSDIIEILKSSLLPSNTRGCPPGQYGDFVCVNCSAGTYAFSQGSTSKCPQCQHGTISPSDGAQYCKMCSPGHYSNTQQTECLPCPQGTHSSLAGAWTVEQCLSSDERRQQLNTEAVAIKALIKLSPVFSSTIEKRVLLQGSGGAANFTLTDQERCLALAQHSMMLSGGAAAYYGVDLGSAYGGLLPSSLNTAIVAAMGMPYLDPYMASELLGPCVLFNDNTTTAPMTELPPVNITATVAPPQTEDHTDVDERLSDDDGSKEKGVPSIQSPSSDDDDDDTSDKKEGSSSTDDDDTGGLPSWSIVLAALLAIVIVFPLTVWLVRWYKCRPPSGSSLLVTEDDGSRNFKYRHDDEF